VDYSAIFFSIALRRQRSQVRILSGAPDRMKLGTPI
jgi:hypothetical protein